MKLHTTIYKFKKKYSIETLAECIKDHLRKNNNQFEERIFPTAKHNFHLIVTNSDEKDSEWLTFFPKNHIQNISFGIKTLSLVLLAESNEGIYGIIGGQFYQYILPHLDSSYGLNTYARIMTPSKDQIITITTRGVAGLRAGMKEQFKENYHIMDYIKFGKIPTELKIKLPVDISRDFFDEFITNESQQIILDISAGISIGKKISFYQLEELISTLDKIEKLPASDFFSSYKEISDENQIKSTLKPALISKLFNERGDIMQGKISNFEVCYPNKVEEFYSADEYRIIEKSKGKRSFLIGKTNLKSEILPIILYYLSRNGSDTNLSVFTNKIYNIYISSYKIGSKKPSLHTALIYHLNSEIVIQNLGNLIFLDSKWYKLRTKFIKEIDENCTEIITNNSLKNKILNEKWEKENLKREGEKSYNERYLKPTFWVTDRIIFDSIELADIIHINDGFIYLCHIKYGFSTELRELYSQIITSARRLKSDLRDTKKHLLEFVYKHLKAQNQISKITADEFIDHFTKNQIKYVMAFTGHLKNKNIQDNISKYPSNIAKLSIIQCFTEMRTGLFDIGIEIIDNSNCFD